MGAISSVSTQLGKSTARSACTPFCNSRCFMFSEMVETAPKRVIARRSRASAPCCIHPSRRSSPSSKAASTSKSCTCSQERASATRAVISAERAENSDGSTASTASGRQRACPSITGRLLSMKEPRCSRRVAPVGRLGT